ncbi:hypothetical protein [Streptomyces sp. NPDC059224]|uniref:hypothetical protein n=1 Tax=Streptomyces sp. NPDC059224 TaxID=3346775 RepID=UPI0036AF0D9B
MAAGRARARATAQRVGRLPPPPGPFRPGFRRGPIRGPWLTSVFGLVLLMGVPVLFITGMLSCAACNSDLSTLNDETPDKGVLGFCLFASPTHPSWPYRLLQSVHVTLGVVLVPVPLAKLWSVIPKLFAWLPARSVAHGLQRLSLLMLVGGVIFEFVTGILNIELYYVFPGPFYRLHLYGAWVFIAAFAVHVCLRLGRLTRTLRSRSLRTELRTDLARTVPEPPDPDGLVAAAPALPTMTRRGARGMMSAGSLLLRVATAGQSIGGRLRAAVLLAPHTRDPGSGPNAFRINKAAAKAGITPALAGPARRLEVHGRGAPWILTREQLLAMSQQPGVNNTEWVHRLTFRTWP